MKRNSKSNIVIFTVCLAATANSPAFAQQSITNSLLGTTDIPAYIQEVPMLPATLEEAAYRAYGGDYLQPDHQSMDNFYKPAEDKIRLVQQRYEDYCREKYGNAAPDMEAMKQDINRNPIVKGMGGVDAVQDMSQQQAEEAATQAANQYIADPFAASGINSPGMTALYQKMMSDPAYARRFEKMSEQERMAELQKYMANDPAVANTPERAQQARQQMAHRDNVTNSMEINQKLTEMSQEMYAVVNKYGERLQAIDNQPGNHAEIDADFNRKYNALPEIIAGEAGRQKDPELEKKLRIETAARHREFAAASLKQYIPLLDELKAQYVRIADSYMQFIAANRHRVNGDPAGLYDGTNTELAIANFESSLLGSGLDIIRQARQLTRNTATWEQNYQEVMQAYLPAKE
ncbi:MAG: hypothetical protein H6559_37090 [Lewinellaceae bacterium]|nr:hypothetical protein [Lewinellaceae bacterium]